MHYPEVSFRNIALGVKRSDGVEMKMGSKDERSFVHVSLNICRAELRVG